MVENINLCEIVGEMVENIYLCEIVEHVDCFPGQGQVRSALSFILA